MDINFHNIDKTVFNYRTCVVIINDNRLLLHKMEKDDFWTLVGGRVEMLESSDCAIKREMKEELGEKVEIDRLLWIVENFFRLKDEDYHEILTIYLATIPKESSIINQKESFYGVEGDRLIFKWFKFDEIHNLNIKPSFLKNRLTNLPNNTTHIIHREI